LGGVFYLRFPLCQAIHAQIHLCVFAVELSVITRQEVTAQVYLSVFVAIGYAYQAGEVRDILLIQSVSLERDYVCSIIEEQLEIAIVVFQR
jgi:hypothetical protein